jgi:hypothetical protein
MRNITGIAACCAPSGHAAAAPLSSAMKSRRFTPMPPVLQRKRVAHLKLRQETVRCGISTPTAAFFFGDLQQNLPGAAITGI